MGTGRKWVGRFPDKESVPRGAPKPARKMVRLLHCHLRIVIFDTDSI